MKTNGFYDFKKDREVAEQTEIEISDLLNNLYGMTLINRCYNNKYDIRMLTKSGKQVTFEIKEDFTHARTGNIGLEFESWGRPAGIAVSQADYYIYKVHNSDNSTDVIIIKTEVLKKMIADEVYFRIVCGGDNGSNSMNYLFKDYDFYKFGRRIA